MMFEWYLEKKIEEDMFVETEEEQKTRKIKASGLRERIQALQAEILSLKEKRSS